MQAGGEVELDWCKSMWTGVSSIQGILTGEGEPWTMLR